MVPTCPLPIPCSTASWTVVSLDCTGPDRSPRFHHAPGHNGNFCEIGPAYENHMAEQEKCPSILKPPRNLLRPRQPQHLLHSQTNRVSYAFASFSLATPLPDTEMQMLSTTFKYCERSKRQPSLSPICTECTHCVPRPIPNSYWATPFLLACEYPWSPYEQSTVQKLDKLLAAGVRTFIDLTECGELSPYYPHLPTLVSAHGIDISEIEYHQFPIQDRSLPESRDYMFHILSALQDNQKRGRISAVHCRGGIGRTGMVVGCWLVESEAAKSGEEALRMIADEWKTVEKCKRYPHSPETGPQFEFVRNFRPSVEVEVA
ncbi:hypothetical protein ID866_11562 [Astraeus odoratus]|nr:hypothetical protein ID866_11562 [Astraeus odoratus]